MGLYRAGFDVTGVDWINQPRYPFKFMMANALTYPLEGFDFIWASPPCQFHCALNTMPNRRRHVDLIPETRMRLTLSTVPFVIENVFGAPLYNPLMLCGSAFGLESHAYQLRRHRYFEPSFPIGLWPVCNHKPKTLGVYGAKVRDIAQEKRHYAKPKENRGKPVGVVLPQEYGREAMGIDWMNMYELSEAIPPAYSEYIGRKAIEYLHI
jgi:DNA (cytosine-5)-methyltransferase 1